MSCEIGNSNDIMMRAIPVNTMSFRGQTLLPVGLKGDIILCLFPEIS